MTALRARAPQWYFELNGSSCKGCACVKAKQFCDSCLPRKLGNCSNRPSAASRPPTTLPTVDTTSTGSDSKLLTSISPSPSTLATTATAAVPQRFIPTVSGDPPYHPSQPTSNTLPLDQQSSPTSHLASLPAHASMSTPTFVWEKLTGSDFANSLNAIYSEVVHWRRNCFSVPYGKAGKEFVRELSRLYSAYGSASVLESVALKAAIVLLILLLQKLSGTSKTKQHITLLERTLGLWSNSDLDELVREGKVIQ